MTNPNAINPFSDTGLLTINGVLLHTPGFAMIDVFELWVARGVRGDNVTIPSAAGTIARKRRFDEARHSLDMVIVGSHDRNGNSNGTTETQLMAGLEANIKYLYDNVVTAGQTVATYAATLVMPSGSTRSAAVQVEGITIHQRFADMTLDATLEMVIPSGRFV